jgi:hypothetical protein
VLGVLTALALEQTVEWLHWCQLAAEAEHDLGDSFKRNLNNAVIWIATEPCEKARLRELTQALRESSPRWRAVQGGGYEDTSPQDWVIPAVINTPNPIWTHDAWETAGASGVLNHMPRERVLQYSFAFRRIDLARNWQRQAREESRKLSALVFDGPISPPERAGYLNTLGSVEYFEYAVTQQSRNLLREGGRLGIGFTQKEINQRVALARTRYGACVADLKLPIR